MELIGSLSSPFVRKARIVLLEKKLECDFVLDNPWQPNNRVSQNSPLGQVPCLISDTGDAVFDSRVIVEFLDSLSPVCKLLPSDNRSRMAVKAWEALADGMLDAAISARLERTWDGRREAERSSAWIERKLGQTQAAVEAMAEGLAEQSFCVGGVFSLADIAVGVALDWLDFRFPELSTWQERHPALRELQLRLQARPSFVATAPKG